MAQYNFKGDIDNISERQLQYINTVILELGFQNSKVFFEPVGKAGDNYAANVRRITIDGTHGSLKVIAKIAPTVDSIRKAMNSVTMFRNEHIMYTDVLPTLVKLQKDAEIPEEDTLRFAKCYGSLQEPPNEVILLEDLKVSGFIMLDRFSPLSEECVKSVLRNFSILHSLAFLLKNNDQETYDSFKNKLSDVWSAPDKIEDVKAYFQALENDTIAILEDQNYVNFLRGKVAATIDLAIECAQNDITNKYSVIQQGDSWTNNIMFRFEDGKLTGSVMIDYQISKNTSPACDILYMIFNCTDHKTRIKHFYDWIDYYHSELEKSLSNFNLKVNLVYPRDRLDADLKQYSKLMFGLGVLLSSVLIRKTDDAAKIKDALTSENILEQSKEMLVSKSDEETKTLFKNRVTGLIESFELFKLL